MNFKFIITLALTAFCSLAAYCASPRVMVLPDKTWANQKGYGETVTRGGKERFEINYEKCFLDPEFTDVVAAIESLLGANGLDPVNFGAQSDNDDDEDAFEEAFEDKGGNQVTSMAYEDLVRKNRPDILIEVGWNQHKVGFNHSISWRMMAKDAYSSKTIAGTPIESELVPVSTSLSALAKNTAAKNLDEFSAKLISHLEDVYNNGREITLNCRIKDSSSTDFDSDFGGNSLTSVIREWVHNNTVNHKYSPRTTTTNRVSFNQVRIPVTDADGRYVDAHSYVENLCKYLRQSPYNLKVQNASTALGTARIYISD